METRAQSYNLRRPKRESFPTIEAVGSRKRRRTTSSNIESIKTPTKGAAARVERLRHKRSAPELPKNVEPAHEPADGPTDEDIVEDGAEPPEPIKDVVMQDQSTKSAGKVRGGEIAPQFKVEPPSSDRMDEPQTSANAATSIVAAPVEENSADPDHSEDQIETQLARESMMSGPNYNVKPLGSASSLFTDMGIHLKIQSLPILDNLAIQLLMILTRGSYEDSIDIVNDSDSEPGQAYGALKSLFDQTKKLYSTKEPFLTIHTLDPQDSECRNIVRKANLATWVSSLFGCGEIGFWELHENFLDIFVPDGGRLLKSQGALFLDLKTQAFISVLTNGSRTRTKEQCLDDLFPDDLEQRILGRRAGAKQLTLSEAEFVNRAQSRRSHLVDVPEDEQAALTLQEKYPWANFLREIIFYVQRNFQDLTSAQQKPTKVRHSAYADMYHHADQVQRNVERSASFSVEIPAHNNNNSNDETLSHAEAVRNAAHAAQQALMNFHKSAERQQSSEEEPSKANGVETQASYVSQSYGGVPDIPYHTQSAPTQVLYERARLAATAKASPNNRRAGLPSQRRPWTTEEENALMAGLDRVKGPHWSQILAMFGPGGTINESLKDRNQVQLKDKARNLKLFFLKSGIEVPYYLQFVTGELKTRAPGQAAKHEAKELAKVLNDEDRAHIEGVNILAQAAREGSSDTIDEGHNQEEGEEPVEETEDIDRKIVEVLNAAN